MLIVGENLEALIDQYELVDSDGAFDNTSITLSLGRTVISYDPPDGEVLSYGNAIPPEWISEQQVPNQGIVVAPREGILACSRERVKIPLGYFGLLQTKGSLARLFLQVISCDGQIEPGFDGRITFEISNLGSHAVRIRPDQPVSQLFIFKTSTRRVAPYNGRYQGATGPTVQIPDY